MATQTRSRHTKNNQELDLLSVLLNSPAVPPDVRLAPAHLRSVDAQRDQALRGFLRRTWVDGVLKNVEWLLLITALIAFAAWFVDGPVRDWMHERTQAAKPVSAPIATHVTAVAKPTSAQNAALLPYVTQDMEQDTSSSDFITPRQVAPIEPVVVVKQPTRLLIPSIGVDTPIKEVFIVDGVWEVADYAAGFLHGTATPDENSNTVLAGHAGIRGSVFRDLGALIPNNDVYVDAGGWRYHYRVRSSSAVWPTQIDVIAPTNTPILTMLTCTNWDTQRLVVVADLADTQPSPGA